MTVVTRSQIVDLLHRHRFPLSDEKMLQAEMALAFTKAGLSFRREVRLDDKDIVDFMVDVPESLFKGIAIEVKIGGARRAIFRQIERYSLHEAVGEILLATNVPMTLPREINGKPASVALLGMGWL